MSVQMATGPAARDEEAESPGRSAADGTTALRLRVLGPMSAQYDGADRALGPRRHRALLALLLLRLGRVVPTGVLIDDLWGYAPPRRAVATLQSYVCHLRRALDSPAGRTGPSLLHYRAPGYVLRLAPEQVDVQRFELTVAAGNRLLERRNLQGARDVFTDALDLWQGSPYEEFEEIGALADESGRLEQIRLTAVEGLAEARLALGEAADVAAELAPEARRHPTRERLVGHLMTALSSLGRQAEALRVHERTRVCLAEEFGVDIGAELRRVHAAVLRQEPLERPPAPPPPVSLAPAATGPGPLLNPGPWPPEKRTDAPAPRVPGELRVATLQSISIGVIPPALRVWYQENPDIQLVLTEYMNAEELQAAVTSGAADVAVGPLPASWPSPVRLLGTEEFAIVLPPDDPYATASGDRMPFAVLRDRAWVRLAPRNGLARFLDEGCTAAGFRPRTAMLTELSAAAPMLTHSGLGPALVPVNMVPRHFAGRVVLPDPPIRRTLAAYANGPFDAAAASFVETLAARASLGA
ncbi:BTAD domain-containing putative transcriptional regulator [Streptomyces huiliensis]|uniref:BTAD domain-containing putative transcriptional regulator n=1 Tax=Streptomyces huiliensis TaxID=2876027 RepID=UPI001CBE5618|nr:BTAD domain-containing putative transcriptional regulator [Streptomyces huiliensis]MBZ4322540.1 winged helix-turn-helix domain-containing protein [Streptomyces huiliensis]